MGLTVTATQANILRGTAQRQTTRDLRALLHEGMTIKMAPTGMSEQFGGTSLPVVTRPGTGLRLSMWELHNRSGGAITVGIGFRWKPEMCVIGDHDANGTPTFARQTDYKSRTARVWAADFAEANGDSLMFFSKRKWDWLSLNVTTASTGNLTTTVDYTTIVGDVNPTNAWTSVSADAALRDDLTITAANYATGEDVFCWNPPSDWAKTTQFAGLGSGIPDGYYGFRLIFDSVAGTLDPGWTGMEMGSMIYSGEELVDNGLFENEIGDYVDLDGDGVVAFFETANAGNMVRFNVSNAG